MLRLRHPALPLLMALLGATGAIAGDGPAGGAAPGDRFDLSHWKLTLPVNRAEEHSAAELSAGYRHPGAFFTDPATGGMTFRAPNHAATTSGSHFVRSELREMLRPAGPASAPANNWVNSTSPAAIKSRSGGVDGTLRATLSVDHVSTTGDVRKLGRVVVGQIHAPQTEVIRLYYHQRPGDARGAVYFGHDHSATGVTTFIPILGDPQHLNPANGLALGQIWSYEIALAGRTLTVAVTPQDGTPTTVSHVIDPGYDGLAVYFKAGVYNQNNTGDADDYAQATFHALRCTHP